MVYGSGEKELVGGVWAFLLRGMVKVISLNTLNLHYALNIRLISKLKLNIIFES